MPETKRPLKVFLCHASIDKPKVRELYRYLKRRGINPWFDEEDLVGGQDWQVEIPKALATSDAIIICLTKNSIDREGYIQREIKFALDKALEMPEGRIFLIPVKFEECEVPFSLGRYQWVDLTIESGYSKMMKSLKFRASQLERSTVELSKKTVEEENLAIEKAAKEKAKREAAEKAAREKAEQEVAEKTRLEAEELARHKAAKEKAEREVAEKVAREKAERQAARKTAIAKLLSNSLPLLRVIGIIGIGVALLWGGLFAIPKFIALIPTAKADVTSSANTKIVSTNTPVPPTKTFTPKPTSTKTRAPSPTVALGVGSTMISDKDGMILLYVPAGEFTMGNNSNIGNDFADERPLHKVNVASFWIDQTEVTNEMWALCVQANVCSLPNRIGNYYSAAEFANYPVAVGYDWNMAKTYCEWAGRRLPNEAEWEKAARGTDGSIYPWGESVDCNKANFGNCVGDATEVGKYPAGGSEYGALDMAGNVWEWVSSQYKTYPYSMTDGREDLSTEDSRRVVRGGSWLDVGNYVRSDVRYWGITPIDNTYTVGFRCARDVNP